MDERRVREIVREELAKAKKEEADAFETTKVRNTLSCALCEDKQAALELEDGRFICETCAQIQSELAP